MQSSGVGQDGAAGFAPPEVGEAFGSADGDAAAEGETTVVTLGGAPSLVGPPQPDPARSTQARTAIRRMTAYRKPGRTGLQSGTRRSG